MDKNKQLISRMAFLGVFVVAILGIFWLGRVISGNDDDQIAGEYMGGKPTLVEFSDFQCPACGYYYPMVKRIKADFGDRLDFVYKHFPLKSTHKNADLAARASEAALNQGKFSEMHDMLFENQKEWSTSDQALSLFTAYAVRIGLEQDKFLSDIDSEAVKDKVNGDYQEGVRLRVGGTPTFFLNGKKITNPQSYDQFKKLIEESIK